jgi:regulator of sigma E protease
MAFATIAKIRGKPLPPSFLEGTQAIFVILLFSFMLYVTFFDFGRLKDRLIPERPPDEPTQAEEPVGESSETGGEKP